MSDFLNFWPSIGANRVILFTHRDVSARESAHLTHLCTNLPFLADELTKPAEFVFPALNSSTRLFATFLLAVFLSAYSSLTNEFKSLDGLVWHCFLFALCLPAPG